VQLTDEAIHTWISHWSERALVSRVRAFLLAQAIENYVSTLIFLLNQLVLEDVH